MVLTPTVHSVTLASKITTCQIIIAKGAWLDHMSRSRVICCALIRSAYTGTAVNTACSQIMAFSQGLVSDTDIPVEHLDYDYIGKCTKSSEVEKLLKILR